MRLYISLLHCISFYTFKCLVKCDIICVSNAVSISALNPDMYYRKRESHKENKRLPRFACTEVINISEPLKLLNTTYYEKSNFMHITLLLKRVEPISDDLLFPN